MPDLGIRHLCSSKLVYRITNHFDSVLRFVDRRKQRIYSEVTHYSKMEEHAAVSNFHHKTILWIGPTEPRPIGTVENLETTALSILALYLQTILRRHVLLSSPKRHRQH